VRSITVWLLAFIATYALTYWKMLNGAWGTEEQGHGPMIVGAAAYLLWVRRNEIFSGEPRPAVGAGFLVLAIGLLMFVIGSSQSVIEFEAFSQILVLIAGFLLIHGWQALRKAWFPLFFLLFSVPLPPALTQLITMPLKMAVSYVAENLLYWAGYPIGRVGVMLTIGPYQLLVADACSGLNSLFTLEALGLLYMNIMNYTSRARNVLLAVLIVPISFVSNVTRVIFLVLLTYHFGDEVGQGFAHSFSGMVLFTVALLLTYGCDRLLAARFDTHGGLRGKR
jgi:exosortase B